MNKNTIRLIIWGILFTLCFAFGVIGLTTSKAKPSTYQYNYNYQE